MSATCSFCGKPVVWATDEKGTRQILDPKPPIYLVAAEEKFGVRKCQRETTIDDGEMGDGARYMVSHWATCPKAADVKRAQGKS